MLDGMASTGCAYLRSLRVVGQQQLQRIVPFIVAAGKEMRLAGFADFSRRAYRSSHVSNAHGHILNCFEAGFAQSPFAVQAIVDWIESNVDRLKVAYFTLQRPRYVLYLDAWNGHRIFARADDLQPKRMLGGKSLKHGKDRFQIRKS